MKLETMKINSDYIEAEWMTSEFELHFDNMVQVLEWMMEEEGFNVDKISRVTYDILQYEDEYGYKFLYRLVA